MYPYSLGWSINGYVGTNVHVILEQYKPAGHSAGDEANASNGVNDSSSLEVCNDPSFKIGEAKNVDEVPGSVETRRRRLFIFSASDKAALRTQMLDIGTPQNSCESLFIEIWLKTHIASYIDQKFDIGDEEMMDRLAFTLCHRRSSLEWREAVSASTVSELSSSLASTDDDRTRPLGNFSIGFVFTGQGAQWSAMGLELLCYTVFAEALQQADRILSGFGAEWSLLGTLLTA